MNSKNNPHPQKSFWQILAHKVLPIGALGLLGIFVLGHYFSEISSDLSGRYKTYVSVMSIIILSILLVALVLYCSFLMYFHENK